MSKKNNWIQLILAVWVFVSPWALGFYEINLALWSNLIAGIAIVVLNLWLIYGEE
ncbi:MAG: SPW repeat protein [Patescibacteria group bacterium]